MNANQCYREGRKYRFLELNVEILFSMQHI